MVNTTRIVTLPPDKPLLTDGTMLGGWWHDADDGRMVCDLCPRECHLRSGDRGFCFVRQNRDDEMVLTTYGRSTGFCIDPIEKKPLNHFYPGTSVLSFGTAGCNLGCKFCQNHDISKARKVELLSEQATPETIAKAAKELGCESVAYTYNDPIIWAEYAIETAKACRQLGIKSVAVTAGYITPLARAPFFEFFDAANVDLKAFTEDFYEHLTLSHLQPVLDTLQWLKQETDVWFEITNLIIPDANDSPDELRKLCDWVLKHVGDKVPVHFSAFHPDFRMLDRPPTPHETLLAAHELARQVGLKYVYVGNVNDVAHQSTYCGGCGEVVVERDWYQLGAYHLNQNQCAHCGYMIPGHFKAQPGSWGRKRQPIRISEYSRRSPTTIATPAISGEAKMSSTQISSSEKAAWTLSRDQQHSIHQAACEFVAAAVTGRTAELEDPSLGGLADTPAMGVYVSLKRNGRLRGCCGFTGQAMPLVAALEFSVNRTVSNDIRMPPVSPSELAFLDLEVWLLQGLIPIRAKGFDRVREIQVGRDGLLINRGDQRGLLLPGVATENRFDEETFLCQVCIKANLPPTAWRETDTDLQRFEGTSIHAPFDSNVLRRTSQQSLSLIDELALQGLAEFCRENVSLLIRGAVPIYYQPSITDGMINGAVLSAYASGGLSAHVPKISLRPPIPLQATLFSLSETLAQLLQRPPWNSNDVRIDLTILEDPAMHGTNQQADLRGVDPRSRALLLMSVTSSAWRFDPDQTADQLYGKLVDSLNLRPDQTASVFSFHANSTKSPVEAINRPRAQRIDDTRPPAVAGTFYPADAAELRATVASMLPQKNITKKPWRAAMVPHAGLRFSGRIVAEVLAHIDIPDVVIIIGPKHTRNGVGWAVAPHKTWSLPGIEIFSDPELAAQLAGDIEHLELDSAAHQAEHAIEVELPLLHHFAPNAKVVGIALGSGDWESCQKFADGLAAVLKQRPERVLLLVSSDMNHYASDAENRRLDELAIQAMETLDPAVLLSTVREHQISMCGVIPAVIVMQALTKAQPISKSQRVAYATSADVTQDKQRVVGYAGMLFD